MPGLGTPQGTFCSSGVLSSPSAAADVDSGPDSAPDPGTDDEDERDTSLPGEDVGELPPAPLGRRGAEGKEPLLPTGREAAGRLQPRSLLPGAAEDAVWEASTPPGTPCSPRAPAGPHTAELSPLAAPGAGAQGAEPDRIPGEVRAGGSSSRGKGFFYVLLVPSGDSLPGLLLQGG